MVTRLTCQQTVPTSVSVHKILILIQVEFMSGVSQQQLAELL